MVKFSQIQSLGCSKESTLYWNGLLYYKFWNLGMIEWQVSFLCFRYGNEDKLVTIFGVMQALVSFVQDSSHDTIRSVIVGEHRVVFLHLEHLILVCVSRGCESDKQIRMQLNYLYNQVISVLTISSLRKIFKQRRNYDLRRQLSGSEKFLDNLLNMMENEPGLLLSAVRCLPLESATRDMIAQSIVQCAKVKVSIDQVFIKCRLYSLL